MKPFPHPTVIIRFVVGVSLSLLVPVPIIGLMTVYLFSTVMDVRDSIRGLINRKAR